MVFLRSLLASLVFTRLSFAYNKTSDNVSSRLMINIPQYLSKQEGYDHREALFGFPPYGGSIAQNVYYADADLCDPNVDKTIGYPERDMKDGKMLPWQSPFILMVDRGECTFVMKVRNAQRAGAAGVIIADDTCLCDDTECMRDSGSTTCESTEPIMADDGSGNDISIPSFLMFKRDADKVKAELKNNQPVQIEMSWSLPTPDDRVEYDLWTVPGDPVSREFLNNFKTVSKALDKDAYFTPHMYIYDGVRSHCQGSTGENYCYNLCTNNGRYCSTDPDNDLEKGVSGADVVRESLRRLCIWSFYGMSDGIGEKWWDYVFQFQTRCSDPDYFANPDCIKDVYKNAKIEGDKIEQCMKDSGGTEGDVQNQKLEMEIQAQTKQGVVVIPTAFVNNVAIRGGLTSSNVFNAICAGYSEGSTPDICGKCTGCSDVPGCVSVGYCKAGNTKSGGGGGGGGVSTHTFAMSMLFIIALFTGVGVWHYKRTRDEMRDQVRGILAEYMPLEDQDGGGAMDFARGVGTTSLIS